MKTFITIIVFSIITQWGCSSHNPIQRAHAENGDGRHSYEGKPVTFSSGDHRVTVYHTNMEASNNCPTVTLFNLKGNQLDDHSLCQVTIKGYRPFDARKDFAYISFENYRMVGDNLLYDIDLALLQGSAFTAKCKLSIENDKLQSIPCKQH